MWCDLVNCCLAIWHFLWDFKGALQHFTEQSTAKHNIFCRARDGLVELGNVAIIPVQLHNTICSSQVNKFFKPRHQRRLRRRLAKRLIRVMAPLLSLSKTSGRRTHLPFPSHLQFHHKLKITHTHTHTHTHTQTCLLTVLLAHARGFTADKRMCFSFPGLSNRCGAILASTVDSKIISIKIRSHGNGEL